jgi:hypothetical protein
MPSTSIPVSRKPSAILKALVEITSSAANEIQPGQLNLSASYPRDLEPDSVDRQPKQLSIAGTRFLFNLHPLQLPPDSKVHGLTLCFRLCKTSMRRLVLDHEKI